MHGYNSNKETTCGVCGVCGASRVRCAVCSG